MLIMLLLLVIAVLLVILAVRSPKVPLQAVEDWRRVLREASSVIVAAIAGFLGYLPELVHQIQTALPQIEAIKGVAMLDRLLASPSYTTFVGTVALLAIVARVVKRPPAG
ncbi:MAG: hypothetical protein NTZ11_18455 [Gammaproteobacteria bacterium]|nr:hypothetical protein [Gammaproteobacteria bacterium]